jgi:hypothetical protein
MIQRWNGCLKIESLRWSTFTVVRPKPQIVVDKASPHVEQDWAIKGCQKTPLIMSVVKELWIHGQELLSSHPNANPKFRIGIEDVISNSNTNAEEENYGDLTVMVTNIIPFPRSRESTSSPKGFLRVWDGTGPPQCDP